MDRVPPLDHRRQRTIAASDSVEIQQAEVEVVVAARKGGTASQEVEIRAVVNDNVVGSAEVQISGMIAPQTGIEAIAWAELKLIQIEPESISVGQ